MAISDVPQDVQRVLFTLGFYGPEERDGGAFLLWRFPGMQDEVSYLHGAVKPYALVYEQLEGPPIHLVIDSPSVLIRYLLHYYGEEGHAAT